LATVFGKMMKYLFFIFILCIPSLQAQEEDEIRHAKEKGYDPEYRVNYCNKMIFQTEIISDIDNFYIPKLNYTDDQQSSFVPNNLLKTKFSFDYKFLGLFLSFSPGFLPGNNVDPKKGDTKTLDLSFKFFYNDQFRQEVVYKRITGFYLENPKNRLPIEVFSDLQIQTIGGKTFYIINNDFSYRAYESLTERQIKSAGSIIPAISYYLNNLTTNKFNDKETYLTKIQSFDAFLQVGYMYNYVLSKKWFSTLGIHPGVGINESNNYFKNPLNLEESKTNSFNINFNIDINLALGYNNKNFFSGFRFNYKNIEYNSNNNTEIINSKVSLSIFGGYRFNEYKPVKKAFEYVEKKFGIY
jgi:hypothetical protein